MGYFQQAVRSSVSKKGSSLVAVMAIALGIGASVIVFSVLYATVLRPLPFRDPDRLYTLWETPSRSQSTVDAVPVRARDFREWKDGSHFFEALGLLTPRHYDLRTPSGTDRINAIAVSNNFFDVLGTSVHKGRSFTATDSEDAVIVSYEFWKHRLDGAADVTDQTISLNGRQVMIVGVLPQNFIFPGGDSFGDTFPMPRTIDLWVPLALAPNDFSIAAGFDYCVIGRIKKDANALNAGRELDQIVQRVTKADFPASGIVLGAKMVPLKVAFFGHSRGGLIIASLAAIMLLLIALVNVLLILSARYSQRRIEFAIRIALGAKGVDLFKQLIAESLVLALSGAALGIGLAYGGIRLLPYLGSIDLQRLNEASLNLPVIFFAALLTCVLTTICGTYSVIGLGRRQDQATMMRDGGRTAKGGANAVSRRSLIVVQTALACTLLIWVSMLMRSFALLTNMDPGFGKNGIITFNVSMPKTNYMTPSDRQAVLSAILNRIASYSGISGVGAITKLPLSGESDGNTIYVDGAPFVNTQHPLATFRGATSGYYQAMAITLVRGRLLDESDDDSSHAIVSVSLVKRLWPSLDAEHAIGKEFHVGSSRGRVLTIIGVVSDVKNAGLGKESLPQVYLPYKQNAIPEVSIAINTARTVPDIITLARAVLLKTDRNISSSDYGSIRTMIDDSLGVQQFQLTVGSVVSVLSLVLTVTGIFGVISCWVNSRIGEIGVRYAVGAQRSEVMHLVLVQAFVPVIIGLAVAICLAIPGAYLLRAIFYGVAPLDPLSICSATALIIIAAAVGCISTLIRVSRVQPAVCLRNE